jgi:hypothetical protein
MKAADKVLVTGTNRSLLGSGTSRDALCSVRTSVAEAAR